MTAAIAVSAPCWTRSGRDSLRRRIGRAEAKGGGGGPRPQGGAELAGTACSPLAPGRDERRHGGEVIRVGGVAKAEEHCDREHDPDRCPIGEGRDSVVESEHGASSQVICGMERTA